MANDKRLTSDLLADPRRRRFFRRFATEAMSSAETLRSVPQGSLALLETLPDDVLSAMVPAWQTRGPIRLEGSRLLRSFPGEHRVATLLQFRESEMRLLALFDGVRSLSHIARVWADEAGISEAQSRLLTKRMFIFLAKLMVLVPASPPPESTPLRPPSTETTDD